MCLNTCFQFLNNITCISTYFFTHTNFQKNWNCYLNTRTKQAVILFSFNAFSLFTTKKKKTLMNLILITKATTSIFISIVILELLSLCLVVWLQIKKLAYFTI